MIPVLLYSHEAEPVTNALLDSKLDKDLNLVKLSLNSLLKKTSIFDEINEDQVKIQWTIESGEIIRNTDNFFLLNRVLTVPHELFDEFDTVDRAYALSEFSAYLAFAIESFPKCSARPAPFGLSGNHFSLPRQWDMIKKGNLNLVVPDYHLGNLLLIPKNPNFVYSTPHNYYFWKPNSGDHTRYSFAFERPLGIPIICCVLGDDVEIYPYKQDEHLNSSDSHFIKEIAFSISRLFDFPISEILLFYDATKISFGMISSIPYSSKNKPWFNTLLQTFLKNELAR